MALLLALSLLVLAGCSNKTDNQQTGTQQTGTQPSTSSGSTGSTQGTTDTSADSNFNPEGYPIVNEKVSFSVLIENSDYHPSDMNEIPVVAKAEEITNVHINWIMPGSAGFNEKKSLMLASGDYPDMILHGCTDLEIAKYGSQGVFIPQQDLIEKYTVNLKRIYEENPKVKTFITAPDGNIYSTPRINEGPWMRQSGVGVINIKWLENLGLSMPTNIDEFYEVMLAFKNNDPDQNGQNDTIPITFQGASINHWSAFCYLFGSFGFSANTSHRDLIDGKVVLTAALDEWREAIMYVSKLYADGLIDPEGFTQTYPQFQAKISAEPFKVGYAGVWDLSTFTTQNAREDYDFVPPLKGPNGRNPVMNNSLLPGHDRSGVVITIACKLPHVAIRWIDYIYDTKNSMEWIEGEFDVRLQKQPEGYYIVAPPPEGMSVSQWRNANCPGESGSWAVFEKEYRETLRLPLTDRKVKFMDENTLQYFRENPCPPLFYTPEESEAMSQLDTDILAFVERKTAEWIVNGKAEEEWDSYLKELNKMGLQEWLKINQTAYERYISN